MSINPDWKSFFVKSKILTEQEFDCISPYCIFDMKMPTITNENVLIFIETTKILPIEIFRKLSLLRSHTTIYINCSSNGPQNKEILDDYVDFFITRNHSNDLLVAELFKKENYYVDKENFLVCKYFLEHELATIKLILKDLIIFLNNQGFSFKGTKFVIDEARQQKHMDLYVQLKKDINEAKIDFDANKQSLLKYENLNKINSGFVSISSISNEMVAANEVVNLQGEIFDIDKKTTSNGSIIYSFAIYDYDDNAITIKYFLSNDLSKKFLNTFYRKNQCINESYLESFKIGDWIHTKVKLKSDKFTNFQPNGTIFKICHGLRPSKLIVKDVEPKKRVELLCHSNLTAFDGICAVDKIYYHAQALGHKALGVIERFNVQSIPDISASAKKTKIKPLYGCEFEVLPSKISLVVNCPKTDINLLKANYVIFDIETTGLYNEFDELIEFGGIKYNNGRIVDHFDFFVKPSQPLSMRTMNLSHISNEMVKDGCSPKQAIEKIKQWIGDDVLIAHNGINFDLAFLNKICEKHNLKPITNCLIDTMQVSRAINSDFATHRLASICHKYKIDYNELEAHRADKDCEYLLSVWKIMLKKLALLKIHNVNELAQFTNKELVDSQHGYFVDIYVKNQKGVKDLYKLVSMSLTNNGVAQQQIIKPKITFEQINKYRENFLVCPHPTEGEIWLAVLNDTIPELQRKINKYDYIFLAPWNHIEYEIKEELIKKEQIITAQKKIIDLCQKKKKKICAVSDAYYLTKWQKKIHEIYLYVKQIGGARHRLYKYKFEPDQHYLTTKEMYQAFSYIKDQTLLDDIVVNNTNEFANLIDDKITPLKISANNQPFAPKIEGCQDKLLKLVNSNIKRLYGDRVDPKIQQRIDKEIKSIVQNNYSVIYWIAHLLVKKSNSDGYLVGSRGSVGSSFIAYLSNISDVNPLPPHYLCPHCHHFEWANEPDETIDGFDLPTKKCPVCQKPMISDGHNIPFESFLGRNGEKIPDIDLNFSGDYQNKAHNFIKEIFGDAHTFRAGTISTVASKTAYGYVKNYFDEKNEDQLNISNALISYLSKQCEGVKRTTGQHPGGIIIVPKEYDVYDFTPFNYPSNDPSKGWYTTHFAFESLHDTLLKFDILGHDEPTILNLLHKITGIDPLTVPYHDKKVLELFNSSKSLAITDESYDLSKIATLGLPEFNTGITRGIIVEAKPKCVGDLIRISGLSHGTNVWKGNAQDLISKYKKQLKEVIACREDILFFLTQHKVDFVSAFLTTESIRKGNGIPDKYLPVLEQHKVPQWFIQSCYSIKYLFPKAHATAYVIDALRTAWYKVYKPTEFYAAFFTVRTKEDFDLETIVAGKIAVLNKFNELKERKKIKYGEKALNNKEMELFPIYEICLEMFARGIILENVSLQKSAATEFLVEGNKIIPPFTAINGLGVEVANSIVNERAKKPFSSIFDLTKRTKINSAIMKTMKQLHITDDLRQDEQLTLF